MISRIFLSILLVFSLSSCAGKTTGDKSHPGNSSEVVVPMFNADSAYLYVAQQLNFGYRVPNTKAHKKTAKWLADQLRLRGANVIEQEMQVMAYDNTMLNATNIIGEFNPDAKNRILLYAHWDSRPYADHDMNPAKHNKPIAGANDGASGVGVLLELARLISIEQPRVGVDIIFFDAEDYGTPEFYKGPQKDDTWALGAQYWAKRPHRPGYTAKYGILLDMVGAKDARFPKEAFSKYFAPSVQDKVWKQAAELGYADMFVDEKGGAITDDHYYVNTIAKIPSIDIIHLEQNGGFFPYWHTTGDDLDKIDPVTLGAVGDVITNIVYKEK